MKNSRTTNIRPGLQSETVKERLTDICKEFDIPSSCATTLSYLITIRLLEAFSRGMGLIIKGVGIENRNEEIRVVLDFDEFPLPRGQDEPPTI